MVVWRTRYRGFDAKRFVSDLRATLRRLNMESAR